MQSNSQLCVKVWNMKPTNIPLLKTHCVLSLFMASEQWKPKTKRDFACWSWRQLLSKEDHIEKHLIPEWIKMYITTANDNHFHHTSPSPGCSWGCARPIGSVRIIATFLLSQCRDKIAPRSINCCQTWLERSRLCSWVEYKNIWCTIRCSAGLNVSSWTALSWNDLMLRPIHEDKCVLTWANESFFFSLLKVRNLMAERENSIFISIAVWRWCINNTYYVLILKWSKVDVYVYFKKVHVMPESIV